MTQPFIGEMRMFGFDFPPRGWASAAGQILSIAQNQALFSILGTTYGGNGVTTFALPDLRSRVPLHWGQGLGLPNYDLGQVGGEEAHTLTVNEMPQHNHGFQASTAAGTKKLVNGSIFADDVDTQQVDYFAPPNAPGSSLVTMNAAAISIGGGSQPHPNLQPYLCTNVSIALQGIFPSRN